MWIVWGSLASSWFLDLFVAIFGNTKPDAIDPHFFGTMAIISIVFLLLSIGLRLFFFHYLIHPRRIRFDSAKGVAIFVIGSLVLWFLTKGAELNGLVLFLQTDNVGLYLGFWAPAFVVMLTHNPYLLDPRRNKAWKDADSTKEAPPLPTRK